MSSGGQVTDAGVDAHSDADADACYRAPERDGAVCSTDVCRKNANTYEVTLTSEDAWYIGALVWNLTICDRVFTLSTQTDTSHITFAIDAATFEALSPRSPVSNFYGNPGTTSGLRSANCGELPRGAVRACP